MGRSAGQGVHLRVHRVRPAGLGDPSQARGSASGARLLGPPVTLSYGQAADLGWLSLGGRSLDGRGRWSATESEPFRRGAAGRCVTAGRCAPGGCARRARTTSGYIAISTAERAGPSSGRPVPRDPPGAAPPPRPAAPPPVAGRRGHHQRRHPGHLPGPPRRHLDPGPTAAPPPARPRHLGTGPGRRAQRAADGYRTNATSSIDRAIRLSAARAVLAVAGIAAYVSYWHAYAVVRAHGESGITARLEAATIDGLVYASSMCVLYAARHRVPVPSLARWLLGLGIAATLTANMAQGWSHGPVGAVVAAWPAVSLVGSYELLVWLIRNIRDSRRQAVGRAPLRSRTLPRCRAFCQDRSHCRGVSPPRRARHTRPNTAAGSSGRRAADNPRQRAA